MRILFVTSEDPALPGGGLGTFTRELRKSLEQHAEIKVLYLLHEVRPSGAIPASSANDIYFRAEAVAGVTTHREAYLEIAVRVAHFAAPLLAEFQPDIIHCNDRLSYYPFRWHKNTVFSLHLSIPSLMGLKYMTDSSWADLRMERLAASGSRAFIVYSKYYRDVAWETLGSHFSPLVLPLGVTADFLCADQAKDTQKIVVSYFGRLQTQNAQQKGVEDLLDAIARFDPDWLAQRSVEFRIYGKTDSPEKFRVRNVSSVRYVQGAERISAFQESHIVVMPSKHEPFGLVGLEAMAAGCLLLATSGLGMDEYLKNGVNGITLLSDSQSIYTELRRVLQGWPNFQRLAEAGKETARAWTWERSALAHLEVFRHVVSGRIENLNLVHSFARTKSVQRAREDEAGLDRVREAVRNGLLGEEPAPTPWTLIDRDEVRLTSLLAGHQGGEQPYLADSPEYLSVEDHSVSCALVPWALAETTRPDLVLLEVLRATSTRAVFVVPLGLQLWSQVMAWSSPDELLKFARDVTKDWQFSISGDDGFLFLEARPTARERLSA